jgi:hypothetical protein
MIQVNDIVTDGTSRNGRTSGLRKYRVVRFFDLYGVPAADLIRVRKDGTDTTRVCRRRPVKCLPVSCLELVK